MTWVGFASVALFVLPGLWHFSTVSGEEKAPFLFTKIAETQDGVFRTFTPSLAIDNEGRVIFRAGLEGGEQGIFIGDGSTPKQITDTKGEFKEFLGSPIISDNGNFVFQAELDSGEFGYFRGPNPDTDRIYDSEVFEALGDIAINNSGTVVFKGKVLEEVDWRKRIYQGDGGALIEVPESAHSGIGPPSLNNQGQVAFSIGRQVFLYSETKTIPLTEKRGPFFLYNRPVINDSGVVLMQVALEDQEQKVEKQIVSLNGDQISTIASTRGPFKDFYSLHTINNKGGVVFSATLDSGEMGLFGGPDPITHKVIGGGDQLDGGTIAKDGGPIISLNSLNDLGQIAFFVQFEDGTERIYRADPTFTSSNHQNALESYSPIP